MGSRPKTKTQAEIILNLKKAKSLLEKVMQMVLANKYCIEIMQQNLAVIGLLKSAQKKLMENHLANCFQEGIRSGSKKKQKKMIKEILKVVDWGSK